MDADRAALSAALRGTDYGELAAKAIAANALGLPVDTGEFFKQGAAGMVPAPLREAYDALRGKSVMEGYGERGPAGGASWMGEKVLGMGDSPLEEMALLLAGIAMPGPGGKRRLTKADAAKIVKQTLQKGGSSTNLATGKAPTQGWMVSSTSKQSPIPVEALTPQSVLDAFSEMQKGKKTGATHGGTWLDRGQVYIDPARNWSAPFAQRLEGKRNAQIANYNLRKGAEDMGSIDAGERIAMRDALAKNRALKAEPKPVAPEGEEFWPFRVEHGGFAAKQDPKSAEWFVGKTPSPGEVMLQKAIAEAEDAVGKGGVPETFPAAGLKRPTQQGQRLAYETRPKGTPETVLDQYESAGKMMKREALKPSTPDAKEWKFYWTGQLEDRLKSLYGEEEGAREFQRRMSAVGATTSGSRPSQNVRSGSFADWRASQGMAPSVAPPYPYGHNKYGLHKQVLDSLHEGGGVFLPPGKHPKGATFAGDLTGQTPAMTFDEVMSLGAGLKTGTGTPKTAPFDGTYGDIVDVGDKVTRDLSRTKGKLPPDVQRGLLPSDVQSKVWAELGGDPEYSVPILEHYNRRIAVTAKVTGMTPERVAELWLAKKIPLLTATGAAVGAGALAGDGEGAEQ